jgi:hypothetical protein
VELLVDRGADDGGRDRVAADTVRGRLHREVHAVIDQLTRLFGPEAAEPETLHVQDWSSERWTAPPGVHRLADYSLFGHPLYQRPARSFPRLPMSRLPTR